MSMSTGDEESSQAAQARTDEDTAAQADEAALVASLRAALASPLAAGLTKTSIALHGDRDDVEAPTRRPTGSRCWPLAEALEALPASVTALSLATSQPVTKAEQNALRTALCGMQRVLSGLLELTLREELGPVRDLEPGKLELPGLPTLQRLDAGAGVWPHQVEGPMPALTRLEMMSLDSRTTPLALQRLAARGLRVRSLHAEGFRLDSPEAAAAIAAVLRPAEFDWSLPGLSTLRLSSGSLIDAPLLAKFGTGVQQIELCAIRPALLPWLTEITQASTLRKLLFAGGTYYFGSVSPVQLLGALQNCHEDLEVVIRWPVGAAGWDVEGLRSAVRTLLLNRRLLCAVRLRLGKLVKEERGGAAAARLCIPAVTSTLLAAEYHVARCEEITKRRSLLVHELWELSRVRDGLEGLSQALSIISILRFTHPNAPEDAAALLERCRALGDGRWPEWPPEKPLPAITRLDSLRLNASSGWHAAALPVLAAKGFRTRHLLLYNFKLTDPAVASPLRAIFDPAAVPGQSQATLRLQDCRMPPAGECFGVTAQKIVLYPLTPQALPWIAEVSQSPALQQLRIEFSSFLEPDSLLEALRGCHASLEVLVCWSANCDDIQRNVKELQIMGSRLASEPKLAANVHIQLRELFNTLRTLFLDSEWRQETFLLLAKCLAARHEALGKRLRLLDWEAAELSALAGALEGVCRAREGRGAAAPLERARRALERCRALLARAPNSKPKP